MLSPRNPIVNELLEPSGPFKLGSLTIDFNRNEYDAIRNFLRASDCKMHNCSPDYPGNSELFVAIETAYQKQVDEIKDSDHWYLPQYMTRSKLRLISDAEIPRTRARLEVFEAQLAYYEVLKAFLIEDGQACEEQDLHRSKQT